MCQVLFYQKLFLAKSITIQRILAAMPSNYHLICGKLILSIFSTSVYFHSLFVYFRLIFDWKNPSGYFVAIISQIVYVTVYVIHHVACLTSFVVGCFLFEMSFTKDSCNNLRSLKKMTKAKQPEANIFKQFTEFLSFHSRVKQLS